ncbi:MAG: hypothetical protein C4526_10035 [Nitrospiraceae bacterium]|nr:MAG: hypothetical protein C4526_10035 [Nitrospiraceae bacterium]
MRYVIFPIGIISLLALIVFEVPAWPQEKSVTPYGDFCPQCGKYGTCQTIMTGYDSEKALKDYYRKKGLAVEIEKTGKQFIRARIYDNKGMVDTIIFDRGTGRVRSIY